MKPAVWEVIKGVVLVVGIIGLLTAAFSFAVLYG